SKLKKLQLILISLLCGCSAMFVPATKDPYIQIKQAGNLLGIGRPLPAERLIREAADEFERKKDDQGMALAYRAYGSFFSSTAIVKWKNFYEKNGFLDKGVDYEHRFNKSNEYFKKAAGYYSTLKIYDALTNVYLNIGWNSAIIGLKDESCSAFLSARQALK